MEYDPEDIEVLIALAQILQLSDTEGSLSVYNKYMHIMLQNRCIIPPEILNNIAALNQKYENMFLFYKRITQL